MVLSAIFILDNLAVNLVDQKINGRVKIAFGCLAVNIFAANVERQFRSVLEWLKRQDDLRVYDVIKVPQNTGHFRMNVFPDGWGDVKMVTSNV